MTHDGAEPPFKRVGQQAMNKQILFKSAGILAIIGGLICYVSDHLLRGGVGPGPAISFIDALRTAPFGPVYWGSIIGYAALPLWLLGLWPLYRALEPAGPRLAAVPVILLGYALALFPGYHYAAALYALGFQVVDANSDSLLNDQLMQVHDGALMAIAGPLTIASLWVVVLILTGKTRYARWMAIISPFLAPLAYSLAAMIPSPWGAYIIPGAGTLVFTLFFALALWVTWGTAKTDLDRIPV